MRTLGLLLACAFVSEAGVDPELIGLWTAKTEAHTLTWQISASGAYIVRIEGEGSPPGEYGMLTAAAGQWNIRAFNFRLDQGSYRFDGEDRVTVTGRMGGLEWTRLAKDPAFEWPAKVQADMKRLQVTDLLEGARGHARIWQPDAELVGVNGMAARDGTFNLTAGPALNLTFHSPASDQGLLLTPTIEGDFVWLAGPKPMQGLTVPLAADFMAVAAAFAKGGSQGFKVGDVNPVALRAWVSAVGEADRTAWQLGHQPILSHAFFVDALTGTRVPFDELTGDAERVRRLEEWQKGTVNTVGNKSELWLREAQAWAEKYAPGQVPCELWVTGTYEMGSLRIGLAVYHFYSEVKGAGGTEYQKVSIAMNAKALNARRGGIVKEQPVRMPDELIAPAKAAALLWALNPQVPANCTYLQLMHLEEGKEAPRSWPDRFGYVRSNIGGIFGQRGPVPKGERWIWRMIARRAGAETGVGMGGNYQSHIGAVHCDAKSGEVLDRPAPTFGQTKFR